MWKVKIKKDCTSTGVILGDVYTAERYIYDPFGKVYLKEKDCFEYVYNLEFIDSNDRLNFYKNK